MASYKSSSKNQPNKILFKHALLATCLATSLGLTACHPGEAADQTTTSSTQTSAALSLSAQNSLIYSVPLYEFYQTRQRYIKLGLTPNTFQHQQYLTTAAGQTVTKPNHDTVYSTAFLKLDNGPVQINLPATGQRYFSLALMDAYTNNFALRGLQADQGQAKTFWVVGPNWQGDVPAGVTLLRSPTADVWALARTYVANDQDYDNVHAIQQQLTISLPAGTSASSWTDQDAAPAPAFDTTNPQGINWQNYYNYVNSWLKRNPVGSNDTATINADLSAVNSVTSQAIIDAGQLSSMTQGSINGLNAINTALGNSKTNTLINQTWTTTTILPSYGSNYVIRALIALQGLGALPSSEAKYFNTVNAANSAGATYDGSRNAVYKLVFPAGQLPPAKAFWSLTLYNGNDPTHSFFYDNPDKVFALSYPASGFQTNADGSLELVISHTLPTGVPKSNWLPAPDGPFSLLFRTYLPASNILDGSYQLPAVNLVSSN